MFRLTRPLYQALKRSTGVTGLAVHPNPLPELIKTYESTISILSSIPQTSVYRQGTEALTRHKLNIVQAVNGDIVEAEKKLNEGQIEESLDIASDELQLAQKMLEWKAYVTFSLATQSMPLTPLFPLVGKTSRKHPSPVSGSTLERRHHHRDIWRLRWVELIPIIDGFNLVDLRSQPLQRTHWRQIAVLTKKKKKFAGSRI